MQLYKVLALISLIKFNFFEIQFPLAYNITTPNNGDRYDFDFVYNYTKYLHGVYRFNSFIVFSHDLARLRPNFLVVRTFEQALCLDFNMPIIAVGKEKTAKLRHVIGLNNMVFVQMTSIRDSILDSVDYTLEGLHFITILFFYKTPSNTPPTATEIHKFFTWCWYRNMINVALTFQIIERKRTSKRNTTYIQNQVYTYTPFPKLAIHNLTDAVAKGKGEFTTDRVRDVRGYVFVTPVFKQLPYVFLEADNKHCQGLKYCLHSLTGTTGQIYKEYVKKINGTIELVPYIGPVQRDLKGDVLLAPARKKADIVPHPFSELILSSDLSAGSYPIAQTNLCIIIPVRREMDYELYLPRTFQIEIWYAVLCTFFLFFFLELCYSFKTSKFGIYWFSYALITAVNLLVDQSHIAPSVRTGGSFYKIFYCIIPLMMFVITNMFAASLTSLLSTAPYGIQIETVQDLLASDLEIMTTTRERTLFFETNRLPAELIPKLRIVSDIVMGEHRSAFNESYAYVTTAEIWDLLNYQQKHLRKPLFRMGGEELCSSQFFLRFPVQWDSPFTLSLDIFFMITQESGLNLKWMEMSTQQAKRLNFIKAIQKDVDRWKPLGIQHFNFGIYFICALWLLNFACFLLEIIWFYYLCEYLKQLKRDAVIFYRNLKHTILTL